MSKSEQPESFLMYANRKLEPPFTWPDHLAHAIDQNNIPLRRNKLLALASVVGILETTIEDQRHEIERLRKIEKLIHDWSERMEKLRERLPSKLSLRYIEEAFSLSMDVLDSYNKDHKKSV